MITVTRQFKFDAAHMLPFYEGKCHNIHGHTYHLEVTVMGSIIRDKNNPKYGMLIDFTDLKRIVEEQVISRYDHKFLNDFFPCPTAELMVSQIARDIDDSLPDGTKVLSCKLWEGDNTYAEYHSILKMM